MNRLGAAEAVKASGGEDQGVAGAFRELAEPRVDVAAQLDEGDVRAQREEHGASARAGCADTSAAGKRVQRPIRFADPGVAGIHARWDRGKGEARIEFGGKILQRVDGEIDTAFGEGFLNLLDEDAFTVGKGRERGQVVANAVFRMLHAVAGRSDDLDGDGVACGAECVGDVIGLPQRKLGASGADSDGVIHGSSQDTAEFEVRSCTLAAEPQNPRRPPPLLPQSTSSKGLGAYRLDLYRHPGFARL